MAEQYGFAYRGVDFFEAAERCLRETARRGISYLVNAGDTLDRTVSPSAPPAHLGALHDIAVELGITVLSVDGNHDRATPSWISVLNRRNQGPGFVLLDRKFHQLPGDGPLVCGCSWCSDEDLVSFMAACAEMPAPNGRVLVWHGAVEGAAPEVTKKVFPLSGFPEGVFRAILLGDIHKPWLARLGDGTPVCYPGSLERAKRNEPARKQMLVWDTAGSGPLPDPESVPMPSRAVLSFSITTDEELEKALDEIRGTLVIERRPIVIANYAPHMTGTAERIYAVVPADCICRVKERSGLTGAQLRGAPAETLTVLDAGGEAEGPLELDEIDMAALVAGLEPVDSPVYAPAVALADRNCDPEAVMRAFCVAVVGEEVVSNIR